MAEPPKKPAVKADAYPNSACLTQRSTKIAVENHRDTSCEDPRPGEENYERRCGKQLPRNSESCTDATNTNLCQSGSNSC
jgi:hypothetical protein